MKILTISNAALRRAQKRAAPIIKAWSRCFPNSNEWQAECCEIAMIPAIARRLVELNRPGIYGEPLDSRLDKTQPLSPEQLQDGRGPIILPPLYGFLRYAEASFPPGYILPGWNGEPRPDYTGAHAPGIAWNGVMRNLVGAMLVEQLRASLYGQEPLPEVMERAKVKLSGLINPHKERDQ